MKGDARKVGVRTFVGGDVEITVGGSRYDLVKMFPPIESTEADPEPFDSAKEMGQMCSDNPHVKIIDRRELDPNEERAAGWIDSGGPEQVDTSD